MLMRLRMISRIVCTRSMYGLSTTSATEKMRMKMVQMRQRTDIGKHEHRGRDGLHKEERHGIEAGAVEGEEADDEGDQEFT